MQHSELYQFATHFWWLIFPIAWGLAGLTRALLRHGRANRTLDIIKSYADQGKEVPPELLAALQDRGHWRHGRHHHRHGDERGWSRFFLFAALAVGFAVLAFRNGGLIDGQHSIGLVFVAIVMTGLALGGLVRALSRRDQTLPPPDGRP